MNQVRGTDAAEESSRDVWPEIREPLNTRCRRRVERTRCKGYMQGLAACQAPAQALSAKGPGAPLLE